MAAADAKPLYLFYHIQNERGESGQHPNACKLNCATPGRVTLQDVINSFPLRGTGSFHFRFQTTVEKQNVFVDLINPADAVPVMGTGVVAKVLRLDAVKTASRLPAGLMMKAYSVLTQDRSQPLSIRAAAAGSRSSDSPSTGSARDGAPASAAMRSPRAAPPPFAMPVMKAGQTIHDVPKEDDGNPHIKDTGEGDDIYKGLKAVDERGMRPVKHVEEQGPVEVPDDVDDDLADKSDYVKAKIMARRIEVRKAQEARAKELEDAAAAAAKEAAEKDAAKAMYETKLKEWALEAGGARKNIRVLLSTLHTVLWEGARWEAITMAKLVVPAKVKVYFLKAVTVVHPDKQAAMDGAQKFIAGQVFHYLESAFREFQEKEMGQ